MNRSEFIRDASLLMAGSAWAFGSTTAGTKLSSTTSMKTFNLDYAPHHGLFKNHAGANFLDEIQFYYEQGFRSIEDNGFLARPLEEQKKIGALLQKLGMRMGVFVVDGGQNWMTSLASGKPEFTEHFLKTCRQTVEAAKICKAKWVTVVPGYFDRKIPYGNQFAHIVDALRQAAAIFEPHGIVMVLETLSDTPDLFLQQTHETYAVCKAVNSPSCKILYDIYHMQRTEGDLIKNMERCWDEIAYIQIGDNPGRNEPTTGEINYKQVFKYIYNKGFKGVMGMEHGKSVSGKEGEVKLLNAYREVDNFIP